MTKDSILLTGVTGVLGARVLKDLLDRDLKTVYCLVRGDDLVHCRERILSFLKVYDPKLKSFDAFEKKVVPIQGDIRSERFGLSEDEYRTLQSKVDLTIHAAANTNLLAKYRNLEPINVGGVSRIIDFSLGTKQKYLCYVSTYTVVGSRGFDDTLLFKESDHDVGQTFEFLTYQQSKFNAEKLIREASARGLNWKIFRPGQIFGDSKHGYYPQGETRVSGLFYDIFKTSVEIGAAFRTGNYFFDVVPVDYVSRSIVKLAFDRPEFQETYHLTNPDLKTYSEVIRLVADVGRYSIESIPEKEFQRRLLDQSFQRDGAPYSSNAMLAFRWWFFKAGFSFEKSAVIDTTATRAILAPMGLICPKIDSELIGVYVDFCVKNGILPRPKRSSFAPLRRFKNLFIPTQANQGV